MVLLISNAFLASEFVMKEELPRFLKLEKAGEVTILPVFLERVVVVGDLAAIQGINQPTQPMKQMTEAEQDELLYQLTLRISEVMKR